MKESSRIVPLVLLFVSCSVVPILAAAGECSAVVRQALAIVESTCASTGRNQACHGYLQVEAEPRVPSNSFRFDVGDTVDLETIRTLRTQPLDAEAGHWGVALLRVQANLPDILPGTNVTFLLFGDAEIADVGDGTSTRPMQAIRLQTGITGVRCDSAPLDGLLIQTPHDNNERVALNINGVDVSLGSTVLFQAEEQNTLTVTTLEGSANLRVNGIELTVMPGESVGLVFTSSLLVQPRRFDSAALHRLPLELLDTPVDVPTPDGEEEASEDAQLPGSEGPTSVTVDWCSPGNPATGNSPWSGQLGGRSAWEAVNCPESPGTGIGNSDGNPGNGNPGGNGGGNNGNGGGGGSGNGNGGGNGN